MFLPWGVGIGGHVIGHPGKVNQSWSKTEAIDFNLFCFSQWNVENKTTKFQLSICLLWKQINTSDPGIINIYSTEKNAQKSSFRTIQYSCQFFRTIRTPKSTLILTLLFSILIPDCLNYTECIQERKIHTESILNIIQIKNIHIFSITDKTIRTMITLRFSGENKDAIL